MFFVVDELAKEPLFEQLTSQIRKQILSGEIAAGQRLPSAKTLAGSLKINLHTVLRAYQELRAEGLIELRPGKGAVVQKLQVPKQLISTVEQLVQLAKKEDIHENSLIAMVREQWQ